MERPGKFRKYEKMGAYHWAWCDRRSSSYEPAAEARYLAIARRISGARRLLDVGCGDGYLMSLASERCEVVYGIDNEPSAITLAARLLHEYPNCQLTRASAFDLPFANDIFDLAVLADVIEHLENPGACLREISRVVSEGGRALISTPKWRADRMWDPDHHFKEYKPEELAELLRAHFREVKLTFLLSAAWWEVRRRLGKGFVRVLSRHFYNPFVRESAEPARYWHMLAACEGPLK